MAQDKKSQKYTYLTTRQTIEFIHNCLLIDLSMIKYLSLSMLGQNSTIQSAYL